MLLLTTVTLHLRKRADGIYQAELGGSTWGAAMTRIYVNSVDNDHDEYDSDYATRLNSLNIVQRTHSLSTGRRIGHLLGKNSIPSNDIPLKVIKEFMIDFDVGDAFILALAQSGEIIAWGENTYGQLDVPAEIYRPSPLQLAEMGISGSTQGWRTRCGELSMLGAGGLGIQWGRATPNMRCRPPPTSSAMSGNHCPPMPTTASTDQTNELGIIS